jgi:hypothetical protein
MTIKGIITNFNELEDKDVQVVGYIEPLGKDNFSHLCDTNGRIQLYFRDYIPEFEEGNLVSISGLVFREGDITIQVKELSIL